ncbi:hypothetical protein N431DRAFT_452402 [Stipitochalara longipes BDJ]|nr:hypothetical protein N431DRAFT_452402 [Stipitochalara longipes BDJ]
MNHTYAESMKNHPYGYAMYEPESAVLINPGSCGYLTSNGSWTPLFNLKDKAKLASAGLEPFDSLEEAPQSARDLVPLGIPANIGALFKYSTRKDFGAILLTKGSVIRDSVYHKEPYRSWFKINASTILKKWPDIRDRGLWIVTETYTVAECSMNVWQDSGRELSVGFDASFVPVGEISPTSTWHTATGESGWVIKKAKPSDGQVVFFGGLRFEYRALAPILPASHQFKDVPTDKLKFRSIDHFSIKDPEKEDVDLIVDIEEVGEGETGPPPDVADTIDDF